MKNEAKQAFTEIVHDGVMVQAFKDWLFEESKKLTVKPSILADNSILDMRQDWMFVVQNL